MTKYAQKTSVKLEVKQSQRKGRKGGKIVYKVLTHLVLGMLLTISAMAQTEIDPLVIAELNVLSEGSPIIISSHKDRICFAAQDKVYHWRIEVFSPDGEQIFDTEFVSTQTIDWSLYDSQGQFRHDGIYPFVLTMKDASDNSLKKMGRIILEQGKPRIILAVKIKGSGTPGRIAKWDSASTITDSVIAENNGNIGIGNTNPGSKLSVNGIIESTGGGVKFPDGSIQTTATGSGGGLASVAHDITLSGNGTNASPLGVANNAVTSSKIAPGTVVTSLNGVSDNVVLLAGPNIMINPTGNMLTISATGGGGGSGLTSVTHDTTLTGNGTANSPLGLALPFSGSTSSSGAAFLVSNTGASVGITGVGGTGNGSNGIFGDGVFGRGGSNDGRGVVGQGGGTAIGVFGTGGSRDGVGVVGQGGGNGVGVFGFGGGRGFGQTSGSGTGVVGLGGPNNGIGIISTGGGTALAGQFNGNVQVTGTLSKGGGSFKIDHPLDPENKYIYHSFVESPDMMNIYNGNAILDENGVAVVELPEWFEALNKNYRYLLTAIGTPGPGLYVAEKIANNHFKIAGGQPGMEVSWQVTGIRRDPFANTHRIPIEENKSAEERGHYLHPDAYNQPEEKSIFWANHPELQNMLKEQKEKASKNKQ